MVDSPSAPEDLKPKEATHHHQLRQFKFWPRAWGLAPLYIYPTFNLIKEFTLTFGKVSVLLNRLLCPEAVAFSKLI